MPQSSSTWQERPPPTEADDLRLALAQLSQLQTRAAGRGPKQRALHAKSLGAARGTLEIGPDVPADLRHGILAEPRTFPALVRFSNAASRVRSDAEADVRGIAVQLQDVSGPRVFGPNDTGTTQDLLAIDRSHLPFRSVREFVLFQRLAFAPVAGLFAAVFTLGFARVFALLRELTKPVPALASLASHQFFGGAPICVGPHAVHYAFVPLAPSTELRGKGRDALAEELAQRLSREPIRYALEVRLFQSERETPIEDPSVPWSVPSVRVGVLTIPIQDIASVHALAEASSFDPWHALEAHRPLGPLMRARKEAYHHSVRARRPPALKAPDTTVG